MLGGAERGGGRASLDPLAAAEMVISALASLDCLAIEFVQFSQLRFGTLRFSSHYLPIRKPNFEILEIANSQVP